MLAYIYQLIFSFEREHGIHPNTLYLSNPHNEHLLAGFDAQMSPKQVMEKLNMEIIIDPTAIHPHVAWIQLAHRAAS